MRRALLGVAVLVAVLGVSVAVTRAGPGWTLCIRNHGEDSLSGVRVTAGDWKSELPQIAGGTAVEVHVPRGVGPRWELRWEKHSASMSLPALHPFAGSACVLLTRDGVLVADDEESAIALAPGLERFREILSEDSR